MNDSELVREVNGARDFRKQHRRFTRTEAGSRRMRFVVGVRGRLVVVFIGSRAIIFPATIEPPGDAFANDQFHAEEVTTCVFADFVDWDDVWVGQAADEFGLLLEAGHRRLAGELSGKDELERDQAIQTLLAGLIYHAHAATPDLTD